MVCLQVKKRKILTFIILSIFLIGIMMAAGGCAQKEALSPAPAAEKQEPGSSQPGPEEEKKPTDPGETEGTAQKPAQDNKESDNGEQPAENTEEPDKDAAVEEADTGSEPVGQPEQPHGTSAQNSTGQAEQQAPTGLNEPAGVVGEYIKDDPDAVKSEGDIVLFTDDFGKPHRIHKNPQRAVCLYNSFADLWHSLGGDIIARIDSTSSLPKDYLDAEIVGSMGGVNAEKLLTLQPDLVIMASNIDGQTRIIPVLQQNKIEYICLQYESIQEYFKTLRLFGNILGTAAEAEKIITQVKNDVNRVIAGVPKDRKPSVLLLFGSTRSVTVKTQFSTVGAMLEDLGARNIAYDPRLSAEQMEAFSMERVLQEDPDFIFVQTMGDDVKAILNRVKKDVESNPAWAGLTAVKEGRYIVLPKDLYLYKPNKRYGEAYLGLARILYPDVIK